MPIKTGLRSQTVFCERLYVVATSAFSIVYFNRFDVDERVFAMSKADILTP